MEFECHMCNHKIREKALNAHLRSHSLDVYNDVLFWSIPSNIIKLCEHILIAAFNSKYEEIKNILAAKNLSNLILPSLDTEQMNDGIIFNIMTDDLFDYDVVKFVNITEIEVIKTMRDKCSRMNNDQTFKEDCILYLHCQSCRNSKNQNLKMVETHVYNHLRRNHGLIGGGKNKAAPTQPAYELFSLELNPFNIRELLARAVRLEFYKYCSYWKHLGIHFSLSFERLHVTGRNIHSLLMKIQDVKQIDTFRVESIPYLMNHLWQTFFQQEQWEFDYLGLSIGEIPLQPKRKIGSLNSIEINEKQYKLIRKIGQGGFGTCFKVLNIATDRKFACKEVQMKFISLEAEIHSTLNHPNIVGFIEGQQLEDHMYMVLELCNSSVQDIQRNNLHIGKNVITSITKGVTKALIYIHRLSIMHRDIKPSNLLLTADGTVKVCDFGLAARYDPNDLYYNRCGTKYYLAPEVVAHRGWTPQADMWALGATIYMLFAGKRLFEGKNTSEVYTNISTFRKITFPDDWDHNTKVLISDLVEVDIEKRSTAEDFLLTLLILD